MSKKFWPGQLTIILGLKVQFPKTLTMGYKSLAVRVPDNPITLKLLEFCKGFLVGTSANLPNSRPCLTAEDVAKTLGDKVDFIIDGGEVLIKIPSTIIDLSKGEYKIIREGAIKSTHICDTLREGF